MANGSFGLKEGYPVIFEAAALYTESEYLVFHSVLQKTYSVEQQYLRGALFLGTFRYRHRTSSQKAYAHPEMINQFSMFPSELNLMSYLTSPEKYNGCIRAPVCERRGKALQTP